MSLTNEQLPTLKTAIDAETDPAFVAMRNIGATQEMANWFNADSTDYVWKSYTDSADIFDVILWKRMTPEGTPDETQGYANRAMVAVTQLIALNILLNQDRVNTAKGSIRTGIKDALTALPTKSDGTTWTAGGGAAIDEMKRLATKAENLFVSAPGTFSSPADLVFEGNLTNTDIARALLV